MSTWTERQFSYLKGHRAISIPIVGMTSYPLSEKMTWSNGVNSKYFWVWLVPAGLYALLKIFLIPEEAFDLWGVIFVLLFLGAFFTIIFLLSRKRRAYGRFLKEAHKGKEFQTSNSSLFISVGELMRGEFNSQTHFNNGLISLTMSKNFEYLELPLSEFRSFQFKKNTLYLYPKNGNLQTFQIMVGNSRYDDQVVQSLSEFLEKSLSKETSQPLNGN